jgi:hypothetical protein
VVVVDLMDLGTVQPKEEVLESEVLLLEAFNINR